MKKVLSLLVIIALIMFSFSSINSYAANPQPITVSIVLGMKTAEVGDVVSGTYNVTGGNGNYKVTIGWSEFSGVEKLPNNYDYSRSASDTSYFTIPSSAEKVRLYVCADDSEGRRGFKYSDWILIEVKTTPISTPPVTPIAEEGNNSGIQSKKYNAQYDYTSKENKTLTYCGMLNEKKAITIKTSIKINGVSYKVNAIGEKAFFNKNIVETISVGNGVTVIGEMAFGKCDALTTINLGKGVKVIHSNAFAECLNLSEIYISSTKLKGKNIDKNAFSNIDDNVTIYVPKSKVASYTKILRKAGLSKKIKIVGLIV